MGSELWFLDSSPSWHSITLPQNENKHKCQPYKSGHAKRSLEIKQQMPIPLETRQESWWQPYLPIPRNFRAWRNENKHGHKNRTAG